MNKYVRMIIDGIHVKMRMQLEFRICYLKMLSENKFVYTNFKKAIKPINQIEHVIASAS